MMIAPKLPVEDLPLAGLKLLRVPYFRDNRGAFCQSFLDGSWQQTGIACNFVQDNFSASAKPWTLRGLHFQRGTSAQAKLVQVIRGAIFDVAVDIRPQSPSFGQHFGLRLDAGEVQLFVPEGFAHGFMTLLPDTIVAYKVNQPYDPASEGGINWADKTLDIKWPAEAGAIEISDKDRQLGPLAELMEQVA
jgi:dTDP-4-dehydrorhamnose 3,5-epimerase